ncbi:MAG: hypothetical protein KME27_08430 [Lyngbya sp. HA4199-MV5]|nr:hypothetical protein [Lyngbya sp. HA4199-MV5]
MPYPSDGGLYLGTRSSRYFYIKCDRASKMSSGAIAGYLKYSLSSSVLIGICGWAIVPLTRNAIARPTINYNH